MKRIFKRNEDNQLILISTLLMISILVSFLVGVYSGYNINKYEIEQKYYDQTEKINAKDHIKFSGPDQITIECVEGKLKRTELLVQGFKNVTIIDCA